MSMPPLLSDNYSGPPNAYSGAAKGFAQGWNMARQPQREIDYGLFNQCMEARGYYKELNPPKAIP